MRNFLFALLIVSLFLSSCGPIEQTVSSKEYEGKRMIFIGKNWIPAGERWVLVTDLGYRMDVSESEWNSCNVGDKYPDCTRD